MCLTRKKIYTNAHRIYQNRYSPYELSIPCGHCSECLKDKANEWRARTYYEYLDTCKKQGFAIWDRLSYDTKNLPHLAKIEKNVPKQFDFTCFNAEDITLFLKRLRTNLKQEGHDPKGKLRYLIAAEYGQEEGEYTDDKGRTREYTLRPHYHAIFYCTDKKLTAVKLSMHIKKAWKKGKTNGIEDNPTYFSTNGVIQDKAQAITISDYIGKYCMKNQDFDKVAKYKTTELVRWYISMETGEDYNKIEDKILKKKKNRERIQSMIKKVNTFHRQSQNYGLTALQDKKATQREGLLGMPDKQKMWFYQKLPMYYQRKLYYDYTRTKEGKVIWYLNEKGLDYKIRTFEKCLETTARKLHNKTLLAQTNDLKELIKDYNKDNKIHTSYETIWKKINTLIPNYLNGRTWREYAEYIMFHKGRIWDGQSNFEPWQTIMMNYNTSKTAENTTEPLYYNYNHTTDKDHFGKRIIGHEDLGDKWKGYKTPYGDELTPPIFASIFCINENCSEKWKDFDKLKDIMEQIDNYIEWNENKKNRTRQNTELSLKARTKTLYHNII